VAFFEWLRWGIKTLRYDEPGTWKPGQVIVLIGPQDVGKSSAIVALEHLFTGRVADPTKSFISGGDSFNGELGRAELWAIDDPKWSSPKDKENFAKGFKTAVANSKERIEDKFVSAVQLSIFKRVVMTINDDKDSMKVLPLMDESFLKKMIMLDCVLPDVNVRSTGSNWTHG
jgi:hypothetical protein